MQINPLTLAKTDARLRDALSAGNAAGELRVVLTLRGKEVAQSPPPDPESFATREDYRQALTNHWKRFIEDSIADTVRELRAVGLRVLESTIMRTVIADGSAEQIVKSLDIAGVDMAVLDRSIELVRPSLFRRSMA